MPLGVKKFGFSGNRRQKRGMERILLKEISARLSEFDGKSVTVAGWARTIRDS